MKPTQLLIELDAPVSKIYETKGSHLLPPSAKSFIGSSNWKSKRLPFCKHLTSYIQIRASFLIQS